MVRVNIRAIIYNRVLRLRSQLGITTGIRYPTGSIDYWTNEEIRLNSLIPVPPPPPPEQVRQRFIVVARAANNELANNEQQNEEEYARRQIVRLRRENITQIDNPRVNIPYRYIQLENEIRKTYINYATAESLGISMNSDLLLMNIISVLDHSLLNGITNMADVSITLRLINEKEDDGCIMMKWYSTKKFNSFRIIDLYVFIINLIKYIQMENYPKNVARTTIRIVPENSGGCVKKELCFPRGTAYIETKPKATNNNCFFECLLKKKDIEGNEISEIFKRNGMGENKKIYFNQLRKEFNLKTLPAAEIPLSIALKLYDKFKINCSLLEMETKKHHYPNFYSEEQGVPVYEDMLNKGHYSIIEEREKPKKCDRCLQTYRNIHNCSQNVLSYASSKIKKNGKSLLCNIKEEEENTSRYVIHYDIETYRKEITVEDTEGMDLIDDKTHDRHTPYVVGYDLNDGSGFKYTTGDNCMGEFLDIVISYTSKDKDNKYYINAYNGANFDHYFIWSEFLKRGLKPDNFSLCSGSIVVFKYLNFSLIDLCKHLQGTLKDNLIALKCSISKGEFDHDMATRWEIMTPKMRGEVIDYLRADVNGLIELYNKVNTTLYEKDKLNVASYISTSSLTYDKWKKNIKGKYFIQLPSYEQEADFRPSVRGGRTYLNKKRFISKDYKDLDKYLNGDKKLEELEDYIIDADVVSLYPTAMAKYEYPIGECYKLGEAELSMFEYDYNKVAAIAKMGIYNIDFIPNKNLQHSVGGRRTKSGLKWDLLKGSGWYSSVDIEDMLKYGYEIKIVGGWYWKETAFIFKEYIEELFKIKQNSEKGTAEYALSKLFMNALYGKTIQRPIYSKVEIITSNAHYWEFRSTHHIKEIEEIGKDIVIIGEPIEVKHKEKCIGKPTHLGSFILAYSRRIMLEYINEANPHFNSTDIEQRVKNDFYYTDTDSLQIHADNVKNIKKYGGNDLGDLSNDLGSKARIIRGIWVAPKLYMLEYLDMEMKNKKETGKVILKYHLKGKGISKNSLSKDVFESMDKGGEFQDIRKFQMKKVNIKRNGKQQDIPQFSILHYDSSKPADKSRLTRNINHNKWDGRLFIDDNNSIPYYGTTL